MKASRLFWYTQKNVSQDAVMRSHKWMLKAHMIAPLASGLWMWTPMGMRLYNKIVGHIRQIHDRFGVQEVCMPTLQPLDMWMRTGRQESYGAEMLRMKDRHGVPLCYSPTAEEIFAFFMSQKNLSYKNFPQRLYQIQTKFRDEIRPRHGVMRSREFVMKDAYSFDISAEAALESYGLMFDMYQEFFANIGLDVVASRADVGPIGGSVSHEFVALCPDGPCKIYGSLQDLEGRAASYETAQHHDIRMTPHDQGSEKEQSMAHGVEVGHIFSFGCMYSKPLGAVFADSSGVLQPLHMGSYGIGVSRLVAACVECWMRDDKMVWSRALSPFDAVIVDVTKNKLGGSFYEMCLGKNFDVLWDERCVSAGVKFTDHDLLGVPLRFIVGRHYERCGDIEVIKDGCQIFCRPDECWKFFK